MRYSSYRRPQHSRLFAPSHVEANVVFKSSLRLHYVIYYYCSVSALAVNVSYMKKKIKEKRKSHYIAVLCIQINL